MKRMHLVELEDLPWFPAVLRDGGTAFLELAVRVSGHAKLLAPTLERLVAETGATRIVDLCSGGGGPVRIVADELAAHGHPVDVLLTDRYPNPRAFAHAAEGAGDRIRGHAEPVDATAVPAELPGLRTVFNAFHHFQPEDARRILADAVEKRQPIAIFEVVSREPLPLVGLLLNPLVVTLSVPFWRPFRFAWLFWAWVVPLLQPFVVWDGVVSWLRIYGEDELRELVAGLGGPDWRWEIGRTRLGGAPAHATWLLGRPVSPTG